MNIKRFAVALVTVAIVLFTLGRVTLAAPSSDQHYGDYETTVPDSTVPETAPETSAPTTSPETTPPTTSPVTEPPVSTVPETSTTSTTTSTTTTTVAVAPPPTPPITSPDCANDDLVYGPGSCTPDPCSYEINGVGYQSDVYTIHPVAGVSYFSGTTSQYVVPCWVVQRLPITGSNTQSTIMAAIFVTGLGVVVMWFTRRRKDEYSEWARVQREREGGVVD